MEEGIVKSKDNKIDSLEIDKFNDRKVGEKRVHFDEPYAQTDSEEDEDEDDSDRELQVALQEGLLKPSALNYVVEKKRPIINKSAEMKEKLKLFAKNLPWIESLDVDVKTDIASTKLDDDFQRELLFYKQAKEAASVAINRLLKMNVKVFRPADYYAEMAKADDHMQKVRKRLLDIKQGKERQEAIKRMREEKKFAVKVQKDVLQKRQTEKRKLMEAVKKHKKGMKAELDQMLNNAKRLQEEEDFDSKLPQSEGNLTKKFGHKLSRKARDRKFGFGGQKKRSKQNTKASFDDVRFAKNKLKRRKGPMKPRGRR
uniref:rRNA-processing protein EBP2 homolog n=1 Tax=Syphacia muris TaxID=451379 RepID=A0A0N5AQ05_9BILA